MLRSIRYTDQALADLSDIRAWLTQPGSGSASRKRLFSIRTAINRLKDFPYLSSLSGNAGVRELPCPRGYRAIYRLIPDTGRAETAGDVLILRIFGPGQSRETFE